MERSKKKMVASSGNSDLLYAERDPIALDEAGSFYYKHVSAMTAEGLHSKSAIAAELGYRDFLIKQALDAIEHLCTENTGNIDSSCISRTVVDLEMHLGI